MFSYMFSLLCREDEDDDKIIIFVDWDQKYTNKSVDKKRSPSIGGRPIIYRENISK